MSAVPEVSVILPTFNRLEFLESTIQSVNAQTHPDWELIIADDGSAEATRHYLRRIVSPRVETIFLPHSGNPSLVRNAAISAATGRYLAFLDSDDVWAPTKLERQVEALRGSAAARWSYTLCDHIDASGAPISRVRLPPTAFRDGWIFEPLLKLEFAIAMPAIVAERELVLEVGGFDVTQRFAEFHDLALRLAMKSEVVAVRERLCSVRRHTQHYSADRVADYRGWMQLYGKMTGLTQKQGLRSYCRAMQAKTSLRVARACISVAARAAKIRLGRAYTGSGEFKERALRTMMPSRMRIVPQSWPLRPAVCPCDIHFCEYLEERDLRGKSIFHFGTGGHHLVGLRSRHDGRGNHVLGLTISPREHASYVKRVIRDPALANSYKVLFADVHSLSCACLPEFDMVTLFHLCEFSGSGDVAQQIDDAKALRLFCSKLTHRGLILIYSGSFGHARLAPLVDQAVDDGLISFVETYKSLKIFRASDRAIKRSGISAR